MDDGHNIRLVIEGAGADVRVSPDGRWLSFVRWQDNAFSTLELRDAHSTEVVEIRPDTSSGMLHYSFDPEGRRLAYMDLGNHTGAGVPWALIIADLESGASVRYDALMASTEGRPLPGAPVGWSRRGARDRLIIDTFLPYTEGAWMGVWIVSLPAGPTSGLLESLALDELVPSGVYGSSVLLSPDGQMLAYLGRDLEYTPDNYIPEFYDLAVNQIGVARLGDLSRSTIVELDDGSALARAVAWAPSSERLLFSQGRYEGEYLSDVWLKSTDLGGTIVAYGPMTIPTPGGLLELAWCDPSRVFYVTWDGSDGSETLFSFDLNTGASTELAVGKRVEIVGCAP